MRLKVRKKRADEEMVSRMVLFLVLFRLVVHSLVRSFVTSGFIWVWFTVPDEGRRTWPDINKSLGAL